MKKPTIIGVTGSFGTGKSTVAAMFSRLGAVVVDADKIAHDAILPGEAVYKKVLSLFGAGILSKNGRIDRRKLGKIIFSNKKKRALLNSLIHPEVVKEIRIIVQKRRSSGKVFVIDVPLLIEAGFVGHVDKLIVVTVDRKTQAKRCMKKWSLSRSDVEKRIRSQMSLSKKERLADFIIDNSKSFYSTKKEVQRIWEEISND